MSKLWIIGDSFMGSNDIKNGAEPSWTQIICKKFKGGKYYVSSKGSRDFQTILDIFLKNLKNISKDDFVIIVIPALYRVRLPLEMPSMDVEISNEFLKIEDKKNILDYFIGANSYVKTNYELKLEEPLCNISESILENEINGIWSITNASNASKQNYIEILKSLKTYLPFEIFIWSWENEMVSELVDTKDKIKNEIGFWHTLYDVWKETEGLGGAAGDHHFSPKMHKAFADYIIVKFPQFFNL